MTHREFRTNPRCIYCTDDPTGFNHYHCGECGEGPVNMFASGHVCPDNKDDQEVAEDAPLP